jgi:hypothetical protein
MNRTLELALTKHRLMLEAAMQREELAEHAAGLQPLFHAADQAHAGVRWLGRHPEVVAGGVAVLAAARPGFRRFLWRAGQRAAILWFWFRREVHQPRQGIAARG